MEPGRAAGTPCGLLRVRRLRRLPGNASGAVFGADQSDFGRVACPGGRGGEPFASEPETKCNVGAIHAESVFHQWPGVGSRGANNYSWTTSSSIPSVCGGPTRGPGIVRQHLPLVPTHGAAAL